MTPWPKSLKTFYLQSVAFTAFALALSTTGANAAFTDFAPTDKLSWQPSDKDDDKAFAIELPNGAMYYRYDYAPTSEDEVITDVDVNQTAESGDVSIQGGAVLVNTDENLSLTNKVYDGAKISAIAQNGAAKIEGGIIFNHGTIDTLNIDVINSSISAEGGAPYRSIQGGILDNRPNSKIHKLSGNFINNTLEATGTLYGGLIYSLNSDIDEMSINALNNHIKGETTAGTIMYLANYHNPSFFNKVSGNFINNSIVSNVSEEKVNDTFTKGSIIDLWNISAHEVSGNFINNTLTTNHSAYGTINLGNSIIDSISGNFINNYIEGTYTAGAAINAYLNPLPKNEEPRITFISNISGNFINNTIKSSDSSAPGGAISLSNNAAEENLEFKVGTIDGNFTNNQAQSNTGNAYGGAIYQEEGTVSTINADFNNNHTLSESKDSGGGAINSMKSRIETITGNFTNNYAVSNQNRASAGAINNNNSSFISAINGNFTNNYARSYSSNNMARGGALLNFGTIEAIKGDFSGNYAKTDGTGAIGGAIFNAYGNETSIGAINTLSGKFENNRAIALGENGYAQGGAIYNMNANANITIDNAEFTNNYVEGTLDTTNGGAIWNAGNIKFTGNNHFADNYVKQGTTRTANDIYNTGTLTVAENATLDINSGINGNNGTINVEQGATLALNNATVKGNTLVLADKANVSFNLNALGTETTAQAGGYFDGDVKLNGTNTLKVNTYIANGGTSGTGTYEFAKNIDDNNGSWNIEYTGNGLYNYNLAIKDDENTNQLAIQYERKTANEVADSLNLSTAEANQVLAIAGTPTENETFNHLSESINRQAQAEDSTLSATLQDFNDNIQAVSESARMQADTLNKSVNNHLRKHLSNQETTTEKDIASLQEPSTWAAALYQTASHDGDADFEADITGVIIGTEAHITPEVLAGIGYSYMEGDMDSGRNKSTDITTHSLFGYGQYEQNDWFANAILSYSFSEYDQHKNILGVSVNGKSDLDILALQLTGGKRFNYTLAEHQLLLRPSVGLRYYNISQDDYTDNAGIKHSGIENDIITAVAGLEAMEEIALKEYLVTPRLFINATQDIKNDKTKSVVFLPNANSYSITGRSNKDFGIEAGLGVEISRGNFQAGLSYEYDWRSNFSAHTGMLHLKYDL